MFRRRTAFLSATLIAAAVVLGYAVRQKPPRSIPVIIGNTPITFVEVAAISSQIDPAEKEHLIVEWSPDSSQLAWYSLKQQSAAIHIYDLESGNTTSIPTSSRISILSTAWSPDGHRFLTGLNTEPLSPNAPEFVEATFLREYDVETGASIREFDCKELGGVCTWARYSHDGKRIVASIEAANPNNPETSIRAYAMFDIQNRGKRRTLIVEPDGAITERAKGDGAYLTPEFTADNKWLIHTRDVFPKRFSPIVDDILDTVLDRRPTDSKDLIILSHALDHATETQVDAVSGFFMQRSTLVNTSGELKVRYEAQSNEESQWEIWDWDEKSDRKTMCIDLFSPLRDTFKWPIPDGTVKFLGNHNFAFLTLRPPKGLLGEYWMLDLSEAPRMEELRIPKAVSGHPYFSPNGTLFACHDEGKTIHIFKRTISPPGINAQD